MRFEDAVEVILDIEGGLANRPKRDDPGGLTNWGISLAAFPELGEEGIRNLTREGAKALYLEHYWRPSKAELVPWYLRLLLFDFSIHAGPRVAAKRLQVCLNRHGWKLKVDGIIGPRTLKAVKRTAMTTLVVVFQRERQIFVRSLRNYEANANGWENRILRIVVETFYLNR
jgi:lysozyme family protein